MQPSELEFYSQKLALRGFLSQGVPHGASFLLLMANFLLLPWVILIECDGFAHVVHEHFNQNAEKRIRYAVEIEHNYLLIFRT